MNKRILSMLLGAMIVFSLCACGAKTGELRTDSSQVSTQEAADTAEAAETSDAEAPEGRTENYAEMGLKVDYPAEFDNTKGYFLPDILGEVTPGLNFMRFYYIAMTQEKYKELSQKSSLTEEEENDVRNKVGIILDVIAIDKGRGAEDIISEMGADAKFLDQITEIGKAEDVTFYILDESSSMSGFEERVGKEYAQEYTSLHDSLIEVLKKAEFSVPVPSGSEYIGKKISFETTDVDGNPVKSEEIAGHEMHTEYISVHRSTLQRLIDHGAQAVAVGTTSVRTLESLYYMGLRLQQHPELTEQELHIDQWEPYSTEEEIPPVQALQNLVDWLDRNGLSTLNSSTQIIIAPGYEYKIVKMLITNFHQPKSTLLLLVGALVGERWRDIYRYALDHDFRFLRYGDSSLLIP